MELRRRMSTVMLLGCSAVYLGIIMLTARDRFSSTQYRESSGGKLSRSLEATNKREETSSHAAKEEENNDPRQRVRVWLVVGSTGRSGTSLVGELLAQEKPSMYFFEPELFFKYAGTKVTEEQGMPFLREVFQCRFSQPFIEYLYTRTKGNVVRHPMTHKCKSPRQCFTVDSLSQHCLQEELRIIKVIRYRIRWLRGLLSDPNLDIKLVHVIRDPRASLRSVLHHLFSKLLPEDVCPLIEDDLAQIRELQEKFPDRATRLEFEKFCLDPEGEATKLWRFLSNDAIASLPAPWLQFLEKHTHLRKEGKKTPVFGTVRNTREEFEAWRWEIDEALLTETENHCSSVISLLGHRLFGSLSAARNASVSLLTS